MQPRFLFALTVLSILLFGSTCVAADIETEISNEDLIFVPFVPFTPCADGSPAGIYREISPNSNSISKTNHVMIFLGGGVCTNEENCREKMSNESFLFSSNSLPQSLKGQTLFSRNATDNIVSSDFTRWIVPYCSQDLFVGSIKKTMGTELVRSGDDIFEAALNTFEDSISNSTVDTLIVAGISAGSIGLMNHIGSVQNVSRNVNVTNLRLILDSVSVASTTDHAREIQVGMEAITDMERHPLCNLTFTQSFQPTELWNIPCCASVHCMLENDPILQRWTQSDTNDRSERLLILDSVYDPLAIVSTRNTNPVQLSNTPSISDLDSFATRIFEIGGSRGQQFSQSAFGRQTRLGDSILWAVTNVVAHPFLLPALEIEQLRCGDNNDGLEVYGSNEYVCKEDGIGIRGELIYGLNATAWFTTDTWRLATVNGESVRNIIHDFVYNETITHGLVRDSCSGPMCVPADATEPNPAQTLIVLNDELASIPLPVEVLLLIAAACLMLTYLFRVVKIDLEKSNFNETDAGGEIVDEKTEDEESISFDLEKSNSNEIKDEESISFDRARTKKGTKKIQRVSVSVKGTERKLLKDVSFDLPPGTITALLRPSGAGKSTLLNVLCGQLPDGLQGFQRDEAFETLGLQTSYLRQFGNSSFQNIELMSYLKLTARLYGASESELQTVANFLRKSFGGRVGEGPNFGGIRIKDLSGGQQRTVAIVATMFTKPKLLLLDEPLSGLDSVSSTITLEFLRDLAKERSCAVFLTLHQPSDNILGLIDKTLLLHDGSLKLNQKVTSSDLIHNMLEQLSNGKVTIPIANGMPSRRDCSIADFGNIREFHERSVFGESNSGSRCRPKFDLWQIKPLMRRLQLDGGHDFQNVIELVVSFSLIAFLLQFDEGSPIQFLFASSLFCCTPVFIFLPVLLRSCRSYNNHQLELADGRISSSAYMFASFFYFTSMPMAAIAVGVAVGYAILGWDFGTYSDQFLFASLYFLVSHQIGRVLIICADGHYANKVDIPYNVYATYSIIMSGAMVSPNKLPVYIRWLSYLSVGYWGITGTMLSHFEEGSLFDTADICSSLHTCILQDGVFLARALGYTPTGSARLSYWVLLSMLVVLLTTEFVLMVRKYGSNR